MVTTLLADVSFGTLVIDSIVWPAVVAAIVSFCATVFGYIQWRRDWKLKLSRLQEDVTVELIKQRIIPYTAFLAKLESMSSRYQEQIEENPRIAQEFIDTFHEALYGPVGLLASADLRAFLVIARETWMRYTQAKVSYQYVRRITWAVQFCLRSDLGIPQPAWDSEIERIRRKIPHGLQEVLASITKAITERDWLLEKLRASSLEPVAAPVPVNVAVPAPPSPQDVPSVPRE